MVQRTGSSDDKEPGQFKMPSEIEHLFQVVDVDEELDADPDIVFAKIEVCGGEEEGRTMLNRLTLDDSAKSFWATQVFLKAICEPYKGKEFPIDSDNWIGRQFYATVVHKESTNRDGKTKTYANIEEYNFDKIVEQVELPVPCDPVQQEEDEKAWDENKPNHIEDK